MTKNSRLSGVASMIGVGLLTLILCLAIGFVYLGGGPPSTLTATGYVAMGLGLMASIVLGVGLALLVLQGRRRK